MYKTASDGLARSLAAASAHPSLIAGQSWTVRAAACVERYPRLTATPAPVQRDMAALSWQVLAQPSHIASPTLNQSSTHLRAQVRNESALLTNDEVEEEKAARKARAKSKSECANQKCYVCRLKPAVSRCW